MIAAIFGVAVVIVVSWSNSERSEFPTKISYIDLGAIGVGTTVERQILYRNESEIPQKLLGIHSSCGCTVVSFDGSADVQVGEEVPVNISVSNLDSGGPMKAEVIIQIASGVAEVVHLKGYYLNKKGLHAPQRYISFGRIGLEETSRRPIHLLGTHRALQEVSLKMEQKSLTAYFNYGEIQKTEWNGVFQRSYDVDLKNLSANNSGKRSFQIDVLDKSGGEPVSSIFSEAYFPNADSLPTISLNLGRRNAGSVAKIEIELPSGNLRLDSADPATVSLLDVVDSENGGSLAKLVFQFPNGISGLIRGKARLAENSTSEAVGYVDWIAFIE